MKIIFAKSTLVTAVCIVASVVAAALIVPALGGVVDGNAWLMCVLCPLVTAWPASFYTFWQGQRLRRVHADLAAAHAELAEAHRVLAEKARRDDMTGMLNRAAFFEALDASRGRDNRGALLIVDADHFKHINDSFGHSSGDEALLSIAAAISRGLKTGDVVGRIGGEEFAVMLPGASVATTAATAERIRSAVEAIEFFPAAGTRLRLTVSIGGVKCPPDTRTADLMRRADAKLYEAKKGGRNLVIIDRGLSAAA